MEISLREGAGSTPGLFESWEQCREQAWPARRDDWLTRYVVSFLGINGNYVCRQMEEPCGIGGLRVEVDR